MRCTTNLSPDSSVGRAEDWKSSCHWFDSGSGHLSTLNINFCFIIHIMALYGRASNSTYSLFLTSGQISHLLASIPPSRSRICGFFSTFLLLYPRASLGRVAFQHFPSSIPPRPSWSRDFFSTFLLPYPRAYHWGVAFSAVFRFYVPSASKVQSIYGYVLSSHAEELAN